MIYRESTEIRAHKHKESAMVKDERRSCSILNLPS